MAEKANILFDAAVASQLRDLAASLDFYINRGPGSGEVGNIKTLLEQIAKSYQQSPEITRAVLTLLANWREKDAPHARPWISITCNHTWLSNADDCTESCPICGDASGMVFPVVDSRRVTGDRYRPYDGSTIWEKMANGALSRLAQENFASSGKELE